ncbi:hypothetical protein EMPG_15221 [Blastomyces silverae]|uniref:Uncharacterized protein n=1 Tax=Blastomyces silverae TaxID=2060906 RepID=A0A0H1BE26_9EURO|nr:hypothetical protein EMPG_15221 [Blastomyces silverae]
MECDPQTALAPRTRLPANQVDCKWWKRGHCFRGRECYFRHDDALAGVDKPAKHPAAGATAVNTRAETAVAGPSVSSEPTASQAPPTTATSPKPEAPEELCGICMETPTVFGLLVNCDHVFCLSCIRSWRSSVGTSAEDVINAPDSRVPRQTTKTCPLCRTKSEFVVPSSVFPTPPQATAATAGLARSETVSTNDSTGNAEPSSLIGADNPAKAKIIDRYLARLKEIPCRYFEESIQRWRDLPIIENPDLEVGGLLHPSFSGECLFGNECHFAHIHPITKVPYIFTKKEITSMKRANHARRARALRRAIRRFGQAPRGFVTSEDRRELQRRFGTLSVEDDNESNAAPDSPLILEGASLDTIISLGFVFYDVLDEDIPWLAGGDDDVDDDAVFSFF